MPALITPFHAGDGSIDVSRFREQVRRQLDAGVDALVPAGTTGESPTLSHDEHKQVIELTVAEAAGRVPVIAGTGSNATSEAIDLTAFAKQVGADAALMVNPYYNKPTQEGLYRHFMTVADRVGLPIVLYNIPGRTGITMTPATVAKLAEHPMIVGIKEATGSLDIASEILSLCGDRLAVLSGDDSLTLPLMSVGARGVISVLANLLPREVKRMVASAADGDYPSARRQHLALFPLFKAMFIETNPIPIKSAMAIRGLDSGYLRLPMCGMSESNQAALKAVMAAYPGTTG